MALRNTQDSWGSVTKFLHWLIALLVLFMVVLGLTMGLFPKPFKYTLYAIHKSTGITILFLMLVRLAWRFMNPTPKFPNHIPNWQQKAAHASHTLLYAILILMPLSGWIMSTAGGHPTKVWWWLVINAPGIPKDKAISHTAGDIHEFLAWTLVAVLVIHIAAALMHHIKHKDNILKRMMPGRESA